MADVNNPSAREAKRGDQDDRNQHQAMDRQHFRWAWRNPQETCMDERNTCEFTKNESHEIGAGEELMFQSLLDLGSAIEKALLQSKIVLHPSNRMDRYLKERPPHNRPKRRSN